MIKNNEIDQIQRRAWRYWYIDGLSEIAFGFVFLLLGLYFWLKYILPEGAFVGDLLDAGLVLVVIGGVLLSRQALLWLKGRITYPRTGYVSYRPRSRRQRIILATAGAIIGSLVSSLVITTPHRITMMHTASGVLIGLAMLYVGHRIGLLRYYLLAVLSVILGVGLAWLGFGIETGAAWYYGSMGVTIMAAGLVTLVNYLHQTEAGEWE